MMDRTYMVKQFVSVVRNSHGTQFMVFKTGDDKFYLFSALDPHDCQTGLQFSVRKTDLRRDVASALLHGYGNGHL